MEELQYYKRFGERTSSLNSFYQHFKTFQGEQLDRLDGIARYYENESVRAMSGEPFAGLDVKIKLMQKFFADKSKRNYAFPVTEKFIQILKQSKSLNLNNYRIIQVGVEPIFNLDQYFKMEPLLFLPIARSLHKKGAYLKELNANEIQNIDVTLQEFLDAFQDKKKIQLGFLNQMSPTSFKDYKRFFALYDRGELTTICITSPIFYNHQILGYYLQDVLRNDKARSGSIELLMIETMRVFNQEKVLEARLGMCPLAQLENINRLEKFFTLVFRWSKSIYHFEGQYLFKEKLNPTKWEKMYVVTDQKSDLKIAWDILKIHAGPKVLLKVFLNKFLNLDNYLKIRYLNYPQTFHLKDYKFTLGFSGVFIALHFLRMETTMVQEWYQMFPFKTAEPNLLGTLIGPFFHNHGMHLFGDQVSFVIFAGLFESFKRKSLYFSILLMGLWLSNPVTYLILKLGLEASHPIMWGQILKEVDYGSSNAVFAFVGAFSTLLYKKNWLLIPFMFHALYVCLQRESMLAIHHFVGMILGALAVHIYFNFIEVVES